MDRADFEFLRAGCLFRAEWDRVPGIHAAIDELEEDRFAGASTREPGAADTARAGRPSRAELNRVVTPFDGD
jgi:hypothetical protein